MDLLYRFQLSFETPLGQAFLVLLLLLVFLSTLYFILYLKKRSRDKWAYRFEKYFDLAEQLISTFKCLGSYQMHFFGRKRLVQSTPSQYGICIVPMPQLIDEKACLKFCDYQERIANANLSLFVPIGYQVDKDLMVTIQADLVNKKGQFLPNLWEYQLDKNFSLSEKESLLGMIAKNLEKLHKLNCEKGRPLYHGFLLPSSFYISLDETGKIDRIYLANHGFCFSIQPRRIYERIQELNKSHQGIPHIAYKALIDQFYMLSSEQKNPDSFDLIGPKSDIYAFGHLAIWLFSKNNIPSSWKEFLLACIEEDPKNRPEDFLDLIYDDKIIEEELSQYAIFDEKINDKIEVEEQVSIQDALKKIQGFREEDKELVIARKSLEKKDFIKAKELFSELLKKSSNQCQAHIGLAIIYYELKSHSLSKNHLEKARSIDPIQVKSFYHYVTKRL